MGTLCLLFLHEKQHVDKRIRKSPAMGMSVIPLSRSIGQFHLCLVLFFGCSHAVVPARGVTEHLSQVAAAFILCQGESGVCHVLVEVLFGLKGCVTMCLCYKRQVGWRAGWFLEMLWLIVQIGNARVIIITGFLSGVRASTVSRTWHKSSCCFCCSNTSTSLVVTPAPVGLLLNHAKLFCVWLLMRQTTGIFFSSF